MGVDPEDTLPILPEGSGELAEGDTVARYQVRGRLGGGGMGVVYQAHDPLLDRKLAIKVLRSDALTEQMHARLLREAQALARLSHPNVVAVHDVGQSNGRVFIAMDLVEGCNVAEWLRLEPRNWREVLDLYMRAGAGLMAAHDVGLIHRDFKPPNVLVGSDGRVCVTDFGLARLEAQAEPEARATSTVNEWELTSHGAVMGSPGYMAPEQMMGHKVGPACDVFSFCVSLFEGLWGKRPFQGDSLGALYRAVQEGNLPAVEGDAPDWLLATLVRGLRADPDSRPALRALLAELEDERSLRQLARAEKLLDEARPLARAAGGEAGFARVASRLLRELVSDTPRPADATPLSEVELSGSHAANLLLKLGPVAVASHFMAREGIGTLQDDGTVSFAPDSWYSLAAFARAAHNLVRDLGPQGTFHVGLFTRERGTRTGDVVEALRRLDRTYRRHLRWRGQLLSDYVGQPVPGIGGYRCEVRGPTEATVVAAGPWPCEMDRAMIIGVVLRIQTDASIEHDASDTCRRRGGDHCVYRVHWGAGPSLHRLSRANDREALLADPVGRYLVRPTWIYWQADPHLHGTIFRGQPSLDDLGQVIDLWESLHHQGVPHGSILDVRDVQGVTQDVFARMQQFVNDRRGQAGRDAQLAVIRPAETTMVGALATGILAMAGLSHPFEFFDDEAAALVWLGGHDDLLVADLQTLRSEGT
jgi:tRNA A-37 threonylcarbamoyl transferase component Bud32